MKLLSRRNIHGAPGTTILGSLLIIAAVVQWMNTGHWTDGHTAVAGLGTTMLFAPDSLRSKGGHPNA